MKPTILLLALAFTGCANFQTIQTDETKGDTRTITTRATATTFLAGKSALANWKASQTDKTQGASVGALTQEANGAALVEAAARGAAAGALK